MCGMMTIPLPTYIHSNAEIEGNYLYNNVISNYWNCERTRLYDTATDFPGGASYDFNAAHLQTELEKGYTIVHIDTHGFYDYILVEDDNGNNRYTSNDADSLINNGYSNIITTSCLTNDFTDDTCLSKSFIFNPNSGIISYLGYSAESWYPESFYINRGINVLVCLSLPDMIISTFSSSLKTSGYNVKIL